jgi:hypothetical protein
LVPVFPSLTPQKYSPSYYFFRFFAFFDQVSKLLDIFGNALAFIHNAPP